MDDKTPKDVSKYQKHYSDEGLIEKISSTFKKAGLKVIYYVLLLYFVLKDENTPIHHKMIIIGALGYFILPLDLISDLIPAVGFTDDAAALLACLKSVSSSLTPEIKSKAINKLNDWFDNIEEEKVQEYDDYK